MSTKALDDLQASSIDSILQEQRSFPPPPEFSKNAHIKSLEEYERLYKESIDDPDKFWSRIASELHWFKKWDTVLEWNLPWAKWFVGGQINLSYNCLDRHVQTARKNKAAIIWESEPGEIRTYTYQQLHREVQKFANVLKGLGVKKGDRVAIYMGMTPELPIAMLRPHRRAPYRHLWRILFQRPRRPHSRLQCHRCNHARRILSSRRRSQIVSRS
jgi:acetyl-CoA synthetase